MDENTLSLVVFFVLLILLLTVPAWRTRRAVRTIISRFREAKALEPESAKLPDEIGLNFTYQPSNFFTGSDPMQSALNSLQDASVIQRTHEGKLYLSEANLASSKWAKQSS